MQGHQTCGWPPSWGLRGRGQGKQLDNCPRGLSRGTVTCHTRATQGRGPPQPCGRRTGQVDTFTGSLRPHGGSRVFCAANLLPVSVQGHLFPMLVACSRGPSSCTGPLSPEAMAVDKSVRTRGELLPKAQERQGSRVGLNWGACSSDGLPYHLWVREGA